MKLFTISSKIIHECSVVTSIGTEVSNKRFPKYFNQWHVFSLMPMCMHEQLDLTLN
jgi:hypothetical protein